MSLALAGSEAAARENFLIIVADDLGVDLVNVYSRDDLYGHPGEGASPGPTPNIDQLAQDGLLFRNAWSNPVCSPTRATILTGLYGFRTGLGSVIQRHKPSGNPGLPLQEVTIAEMLGPGFARAALGKWHLAGTAEDPADQDPQCQCNPDHPRDQGFDYFAGSIHNFTDPDDPDTYWDWPKDTNGTIVQHHAIYATTDATDEAIAQIAAAGQDPWFVYLAYHAPHKPLHAPPASLHTQTLSGDPEDSAPEHVRAMIEAMDTEIGRLLASIPTPILNDTTIFFIGDNGSQEDAILPPFIPTNGKGTMFEGGINVPFIVSSKHVAPPDRGKEVTALVSTVDVFDTIAELAGLGDDAVDSVSLVPYFEDPTLPTQAERPYVYAEKFSPNGKGIPRTSSQLAMRKGSYKLVRKDGADWFYDLDADPFEEQNLPIWAMTPAEFAAYDELKQLMHSLAGHPLPALSPWGRGVLVVVLITLPALLRRRRPADLRPRVSPSS